MGHLTSHHVHHFLSRGVEMVIPEAAVEVAAMAGYEARTGERWSSLDTETREREEFAAQCALEAAAPHMAAQGWDEGVAYVFEGGAEVSDENPYRTTR